MKKLLSAALWLLSFGCQPAPEATVHRLDGWADEIIYFALTDRFADGDTSNNDLGDGAYDPRQSHTFHGGDFAGLQQQLPYLQALGVTALWLTPPVKNQTWSPDSSLTGYHGYWASHFAATDPHLGTVEDYQALGAALKSRGMRFIQDVVTNHTGDYFRYTGPWQAQAPWLHFEKDGAPEQWPFSLNDARDSAQRAAAIYHFTPNISNYQDPVEKLVGQMSGLDDLNTSNPVVRNALKASFRFWMTAAGIDGIRFDTPLYVEHDFWHHFLYDSSSSDPGLYPFARQKQQHDFYTFGETWVHSNPFDNEGEQLAAKYLGSPEAPEMDGILNFPMQQSMQRVFGGGAPTSDLTYRLAQEQLFFPDPWQKLHFIDNHDMPRFRSLTTAAATWQALAFILTNPGVPVLYYGTEQGLTETRPNVFGQLDTTSEDFVYLQALIHLRRTEPALRRGRLQVVADDSLQAGLLLYELRYGEEVRYVAFNTQDVDISCGPLSLGAGSADFVPLFSQGRVAAGQLEAGALPFLQMEARSVVVFRLQPIPSASTRSTAAELQVLSAPPSPWVAAEVQLEGTYAGFDRLIGLVDGLAPLPVALEQAGGSFRAQLATAAIPSGKHHIQWLGYLGETLVWADRYGFETQLPTEALVRLSDPAGDDLGPSGRYRYPTAFGALRSMDIAGVTVQAQGSALTFELSMHAPFSTQWNPPLGFDHVQFFIFLNLNGQVGSQVYPLLRSSSRLEGGFTHVISVNGWQASMQQVDATGALVTVAGAPAVQLLSDRSLALRLSPALLGFPAALDQLSFECLTWDSAGEGAVRPLAPAGGDYVFGGGNDGDPLWMDQISGHWQRVPAVVRP